MRWTSNASTRTTGNLRLNSDDSLSLAEVPETFLANTDVGNQVVLVGPFALSIAAAGRRPYTSIGAPTRKLRPRRLGQAARSVVGHGVDLVQQRLIDRDVDALQ